MIIKRNLFLFFLVLILSISSVSAAQVCCYNPYAAPGTLDSIYPGFDPNCDGNIYLGDLISGGTCENQYRQICIYGSQNEEMCSKALPSLNEDGLMALVDLNTAQDNSGLDLISQVENKKSQYCISFENWGNYDEAELLLCGDEPTGISHTAPDPSDNNNVVNEIPIRQSGYGESQLEDREVLNQYDDLDTAISTGIENGEFSSYEQCGDLGGFGGIFLTKSLCESHTARNSGDLTVCIYNPHLASTVSNNPLNPLSSLATGGSEYIPVFNDFEVNSCISKREINTCDDYKTRENCEGNVAYIGSEGSELSNDQKQYVSQSPDLSKGCTWIDSEEFTEGEIEFSSHKGICRASSYSVDIEELSSTAPSFVPGLSPIYEISDLNLISEMFSHKSPFYYSRRGNVLKNPSFEDIPFNNKWTGDLTIENSIVYQGDNAIKLDVGQSISQNISFISIPNYVFELAVKAFVLEGSPKIKFEVDYGGGVVESVPALSLSSSDYNQFQTTSSVFLKTPEDSLGGAKLTLSIEGTGSVILDSITLFTPTDINSPSRENAIINPFELISPKSSLCQTCYDPFNLNLCTKKKASILGQCSYMVEGPNQSYYLETETPSDPNFFEFYYGKAANTYMKEGPWKSQALASSQIFCELYINENQCTSQNNFLNAEYGPYHTNIGSSICKWDEAVGCFKDSNNDNLPDVKEGVILSSNYRKSLEILDSEGEVDSDLENEISELRNYRFDSEGGISDFAKACDVLPPYGHFSLVARDSNGTVLPPISNDNSLNEFVTGQRVGGVTVNYEFVEIIPDYSCETFVNWQPEVFFDFKVTKESSITSGEYSAQKVGSTFKENRASLEAIFGEESFTQGDGVYNISINVLDSSGNIGYSKEFIMDLDLAGPEIWINSPELMEFTNGPLRAGGFQLKDILKKNESIVFEISDSSSIKSCSYSLFKGGALIEEDNFNLSNFIMVDEGRYTYNFILNESLVDEDKLLGEDFVMEVICSDIFNQETLRGVIFTADFNTDYVFLKPSPRFQRYNLEAGFLNGGEELLAASKDDLNSCTLSGEGIIQTTLDLQKNIPSSESDITAGYVIDGERLIKISDIANEIAANLDSEEREYPDYESIESIDESAKYFTKISGTFNFNGEVLGKQNVTFECVDGYGNKKSQDLLFFYDPEKPQLAYDSDNPQVLNFTIKKSSGTFTRKVGESYEFYITSSRESPKELFYGKQTFDLDIDGTIGWISNRYYATSSTPVYSDYSSFETKPGYSNYIKFNVGNETNTVASVSIKGSDFEIPTIISGEGVEVPGRGDLEEYPYLFTFFDKANNSVTQEASIFYDYSNPEITFNVGGDIGGYSHELGMVFFTNSNPQVSLNFNTPEYRKYNCSVTLHSGASEEDITIPSSYFSLSDSLSFKLNEFGEEFDLRNDTNLELSFDCKDVFGKTPSHNKKTYQLIYDVTPLEISKISLEKGNKKFFQKAQSAFVPNYPDVYDRLIFEFNNTNEKLYTCTYTFTAPDGYSNCPITTDDNPITPQTNPMSNIFTTPGLNHLSSEFNLLKGENTQSTIYSCSRSSRFRSEEKHRGSQTQILVEATCLDGAGFSDTYVVEVNLSYEDQLVDANFRYKKPELILPVIRTIKPISSGTFDFYLLGEESGTPLFSVNSNSLIHEVDFSGLHSYFPNGANAINITPLLNSKKLFQGENKLTMIASNGISGEVETTLFLDTIKPVVLFNIINEENGIVYLPNFIGQVGVSEEISEITELKVFVDDGVNFVKIYDLSNSTILDDSEIKRFKSINLTSSFISSKQIDLDLLFKGAQLNNYYEFRVDVKDKYNNSVSLIKNITYEKFSFDLSGNGVGKFNDLTYYTNQSYPEIKLKFRPEFFSSNISSCSGTMNDFDNGNTFPITFDEEFITLVPNTLNLETKQEIGIEITCISNLGLVEEKSFTLRYDSQKPILESISVDSQQQKYYPNKANIIFSDLEKKVFFNLADTNEVSYTCHYAITNVGTDYDCSDIIYNYSSLTPSDLILKTGAHLLLNKTRSSGVCLRTDSLFSKIDTALTTKEDVTTSLTITGYCEDVLGQRSAERTFNFPITYTQRDLIELEFNYDKNSKAYPKFLSTKKYANGAKFEITDLSQNVLVSFDTSSFKDTIQGISSYEVEIGSLSFINLENMEDGQHQVLLRTYDSAGVFESSITGTLLVDNALSTIIMEIDPSRDNLILSEDFSVDLTVSDSSPLELVEVYVNQEEFYNSEEGVLDSVAEFVSVTDSILSNENNLNVVLNFYDFEEGQYKILVTAEDERGNMGVYNKTFTLTNYGIVPTSGPSEGIIARTDGIGWNTKENAPIISFKTTKATNICEVRVFENGISISEEFDAQTDDGFNFEFDLSSIVGFDLEEDKGKDVQIRIICESQDGVYSDQNSFYIFYQNSLPDYVLLVEKGFNINEGPYLFQAEIVNVGPFDIDECTLTLEGNDKVIDINSYSRFKEIDLDFTTLENGAYEATLICKDNFGTLGPEKKYEFNIDKNSNIEISNVRLESTTTLQDGRLRFDLAEDNNIYLRSDIQEYVVVIETNKKNNVYCTYDINTGMIPRIFDFFADIFSIGVRTIDQIPNSYIFEASEKETITSQSTIDVECRIPGTSQREEISGIGLEYVDISEITDFNPTITRTPIEN